MTSISELEFINDLLLNQNKKIYFIKFMIPIDNNNYYELYEINCEDWFIDDYINKINEKINEFNKLNPIPLQNIDYKMLLLVKENNELIWKEYLN